MKSIGIIPVRYNSSRFPGKALVDINGKTMVQRVYEQSIKSKLLDEVWIATDDERIKKHALDIGAIVKMTSPSHKNGSSRIQELKEQMKDFEIILNIQGDEPFINPQQLDLLIQSLKNSTAGIATMAIQIKDQAILFDSNTVKVVFDEQNKALYFSRNPIPFVQNQAKDDWLIANKFFKHIGLYAFRNQVFNSIDKLSPTPLANAESLEQLNWLEHGFNIEVVLSEEDSLGIDTPADLAWALKNLKID